MVPQSGPGVYTKRLPATLHRNNRRPIQPAYPDVRLRPLGGCIASREGVARGIADVWDLDIASIGRYRRTVRRFRPWHRLNSYKGVPFLLQIGAAALDGDDAVPTLAGVLLFGNGRDIRGIFPHYRAVFRHGGLVLDSKDAGWSGNLADYFAEVAERTADDVRLRAVWDCGIFADDPTVFDAVAGSPVGEIRIACDRRSLHLRYAAGGRPGSCAPPDALRALRLLSPVGCTRPGRIEVPVHRVGCRQEEGKFDLEVELRRHCRAVNGRVWDIARMMSEDPCVRLHRVGRELRVDVRTVANAVRLMKGMGMVEFVGPKRDGEWRVSPRVESVIGRAWNANSQTSEIEDAENRMVGPPRFELESHAPQA